MLNDKTLEIMKTIKPFNEVQVGDMAYNAENVNEKEGVVKFKGTTAEIKASRYAVLLEVEPDSDEFEEYYPEDYNWVVIGGVVFNYDCDPCGVVCFE